MRNLDHASEIHRKVIALRWHADFQFAARAAADQAEFLRHGKAHDFGYFLRVRGFHDRVRSAARDCVFARFRFGGEYSPAAEQTFQSSG